MPSLDDKILKSGTVGRMKIYIEGDPTPYVARITIPEITHPEETIDNTSTGGPVSFATPDRFESSGKGEIMIEAASYDTLIKCHNSNKAYDLVASYGENNYNPQSGLIVPIPVKYRLTVQFTGIDNGEIVMGGKRAIVAKFNMWSYQMSIGEREVCNYDFISGTFTTDGEDLLLESSNVIG